MFRHTNAPLKGKNKLATIHAKKPGVIKRVLIRLNIMHPLCNLMFGHDHPLYYRLATGTIVAVTGVVISKWLGHAESECIAYIGDAIGYGLHGLGVAPYIEWAVKSYAES
jgi:hypothetical protein